MLRENIRKSKDMCTADESIGKKELETQKRIIDLFRSNALGYEYLGNLEEEERHIAVEEELLLNFLTDKKSYSKVAADKAIEKFVKTVSNYSIGLYEANKAVYNMLRYGVSVREELGMQHESVFLIDWNNPKNNHFSFAEEVTVLGPHNKRPDLVFYVNGIGVAILELKRSKVSLEHGIRQNILNQRPDYIAKFFTTMQLVLAGNDTQGLRYGTIETSEKYYLQWKEKSDLEYDYLIDKHLHLLMQKERLLELIHDFVIFDKGIKKLSRPNQYFGVKAAQKNVHERKGGIIWHTQGSGKSLTMVWLTKWIRESQHDSRVVIITDREELDEQIEKLFVGVDEHIYRTKSGIDLIDVLNKKEEVLVCSLVHKFGRTSKDGDYDKFIDEINAYVGDDFEAKGNIFVFVDECHRTQSGKLHKAMKKLLPDAMFIGFTGTPLLKKDKEKSIEVFGPYIGEPYKFDEAVEDGVVLDLLYEARDVEQFVTDQRSIDEWFEAETRGLTEVAKTELKKRWGTMQKVLGSKSRLEKIVFDIVKDFKVKPRLSTGEGNAMLVSGSIYQACKFYELFQKSGFKSCAIVTSYEPNDGDIKDEITGDDSPTDQLLKYEVYKEMLNGKAPDVFEIEVKKQFIEEPSKMKLIIVVDKLLTGFDAPPATYLYIDKKMQDHGLFQAICRVNRVYDDSKDYGYIIDYKDLFKSLEKSIKDYTSNAFDNFDEDDVGGLLKERFEESKERLGNALDMVIMICEPVHPKTEPEFIRYFCGDTEKPQDIEDRRERREKLYRAVVSLIRAYANIANEMLSAGYSQEQAEDIKQKVKFYSDLRETIKHASGDYIDLKAYEPGMRQLMDMYLDAYSSKRISNFENTSLVQLINVVQDPEGPYKSKSHTAVSETIENNVRRVIIEESQTNPKYFEKMSKLLDEIIRLRKQETIKYEEYLERIKNLAEQVSKPADYPENINTKPLRALYDNLGQDEELAKMLDYTIRTQKMDGWKDGGLKEKKLMLVINTLLNDADKTLELMEIIKAQDEY